MRMQIDVGDGFAKFWCRCSDCLGCQQFCPDTEQLIWATEQGRVIYSFNVKDFSRLHKEYMEQERVHAGIVLAARQSYSVGVQLRVILRLMAAKSAEDMINQQ